MAEGNTVRRQVKVNEVSICQAILMGLFLLTSVTVFERNDTFIVIKVFFLLLMQPLFLSPLQAIVNTQFYSESTDSTSKRMDRDFFAVILALGVNF